MNLSPAAQAFWGSIIRHILTALAGVLVTHGYVSVNDSNAYIEEIIGATLGLAVTIWANRVQYWQQIKHLVSQTMPAGTTSSAVAIKVEQLKATDTLPSVFTPADQIPVVKQ